MQSIPVMDYLWIAALVIAGLWVFRRVNLARSGSVITTKQRLNPAQYQTEFGQAKKPHLLVDVRTPAEFKEGHIPGAVNIDLQRLDQRLNEIPRDKPVVLYCRSGHRSSVAAGMLAQAGYDNIYDLGGIIAWRAQGLPIR